MNLIELAYVTNNMKLAQRAFIPHLWGKGSKNQKNVKVSVAYSYE